MRRARLGRYNALTRQINCGGDDVTTNENEARTDGEQDASQEANPVGDAAQQAVDSQEPADDGQDSRSDGLTISELEAELAARSERLEALEDHAASLGRELASTVSRYRLSLLDTAPDVPGELVVGDSAEELETSLANAKAIVEQVRQRVLESADAGQRNSGEETAASRMPAGAPPRNLNDGSSELTARDKIALGLERL